MGNNYFERETTNTNVPKRERQTRSQTISRTNRNDQLRAKPCTYTTTPHPFHLPFMLEFVWARRKKSVSV